MEKYSEWQIINGVCCIDTYSHDGKHLHQRRVNKGESFDDAPKVKYRRVIAQPFTSMGLGTALMVAGSSVVRNVKRGA